MELEKILIYTQTTILETLKVIDDAAVEIALVVDEEKRLIGTVTDGDIRRGLIKGLSLDEPISSIMNGSPTTAGLNVPDDELLFIMTNRSIKHLPIVDKDRHVIRLVLLKDLVAGKKRPNFAVIMAGGLGSRLGIIMTGMGRDGAVQLAEMRKEGAWTLGQDEQSSMIWPVSWVLIS